MLKVKIFNQQVKKKIYFIFHETFSHKILQLNW